MKKCKLSYDAWKCMTSKKVSGARIDTDSFKGYIGLIEIEEVANPQVWQCKGEDVTVCDKGMKWLTILPETEFYCITAMMDANWRARVWYIDMIAEKGIDEDGIPYFYDLYLDLIAFPDGTVLVDDRDELEDALACGDITREQYDLALLTCSELQNGLLLKTDGLAEHTKMCCELFSRAKQPAASLPGENSPDFA